MTAYPDLTVPPEAGQFKDVEDAFEFGYCHALAVAIHRVTGWPVRGLFRRNWKTGRPNAIDHYVAERPDEHLVDVNGVWDPEELLGDCYELSEPVDSPEGLWRATDMEDAELVRELAEEVARRIVSGVRA